MSIVLFDNLSDEQPIFWRGSREAELMSLYGLPVRATTLYKSLSCRHFSYAPDFFKFCEAKFDLAVFYVADPSTTGRRALSVWQARGYWLGARGRYAELPFRDDERTDSITFCEGGRVSNLLNEGDVHDVQAADRENQDSWRSHVSHKIYEYSRNKNGAVNPRKEHTVRLAKELGISKNDQLHLSGFAQSERACKMRFCAFQFMTSVHRLGVIRGYVRDLNEIVTIEFLRLTREFPSSREQESAAGAADHLLDCISTTLDQIDLLCHEAEVQRHVVVSTLLSSGVNHGHRVKDDIRSSFNRLVAGDVDMSIQAAKRVLHALKLSTLSLSKKIDDMLFSCSLRVDGTSADDTTKLLPKFLSNSMKTQLQGLF